MLEMFTKIVSIAACFLHCFVHGLILWWNINEDFSTSKNSETTLRLKVTWVSNLWALKAVERQHGAL